MNSEQLLLRLNYMIADHDRRMKLTSSFKQTLEDIQTYIASLETKIDLYETLALDHHYETITDLIDD